MKQNIKLIRPNQKYKKEYFDYLNEVKLSGDISKLGEVALKENENFNMMLSRTMSIREDENMLEKHGVRNVFWILYNNEIVGSANVRENLNEKTYYTIGNVGYYIKKSARNNGYATKALKLIKEYYKSIGINRILLMCEEDNIESQKVILNNDGILEKTIKKSNTNNNILCYWIDI